VLFDAQGRGGKNKAVDLEDMKFHQCVRLARFENDRTISFIPPDGAFDLMYGPPFPVTRACVYFKLTPVRLLAAMQRRTPSMWPGPCRNCWFRCLECLRHKHGVCVGTCLVPCAAHYPLHSAFFLAWQFTGVAPRC